jgi:hypothetical protein
VPVNYMHIYACTLCASVTKLLFQEVEKEPGASGSHR